MTRVKSLKTTGYKHRVHRSKKGSTNKYTDGRDRISRKVAKLKLARRLKYE